MSVVIITETVATVTNWVGAVALSAALTTTTTRPTISTSTTTVITVVLQKTASNQYLSRFGAAGQVADQSSTLTHSLGQYPPQVSSIGYSIVILDEPKVMVFSYDPLPPNMRNPISSTTASDTSSMTVIHTLSTGVWYHCDGMIECPGGFAAPTNGSTISHVSPVKSNISSVLSNASQAASWAAATASTTSGAIGMHLGGAGAPKSLALSVCVMIAGFLVFGFRFRA